MQPWEAGEAGSVTCTSPRLLTGKRWRLEPCGRVQTLELDYVSHTLTTSVLDSLSFDFIYKMGIIKTNFFST